MTLYDHLRHQATTPRGDHARTWLDELAADYGPLCATWAEEEECVAETSATRLSSADAEVCGRALRSSWGRRVGRSVAQVRDRR